MNILQRFATLFLLISLVGCSLWAASNLNGQREALLQGLHQRLGKNSPVRHLSPEVIKKILDLMIIKVVLVNNDGNTCPIRLKISEILNGTHPNAPVIWHKVLVPFFAMQSGTHQIPPIYNVIPVAIPTNDLRISLYTHKASDKEHYIGTFYLHPEELDGLSKIYVAQNGCLLQYKDKTEVFLSREQKVSGSDGWFYTGNLIKQPRRNSK